MSLPRVTGWESGGRLSPEPGFKIWNQPPLPPGEGKRVWSGRASWESGEGPCWAVAYRSLRGSHFRTPTGPEWVRLADLQKDPQLWPRPP